MAVIAGVLKQREKMEKVQSHWNEVWKRVDFGKPTKTCSYDISNYGRIRSTNKNTGKERFIKGVKVNRELLTLNIVLKDGSRGVKCIHRFVADNFVEPSTDQHTYVLHIDYDRSNNKWNNLIWATEEEWKAYTKKKTSYIEGMKKRDNTYKLNETKVRLIKKRLALGKTKRKIIAKTFGVSERTIRQIENEERWKHVQL